ncbi:hypothetical protein CEXT_536001 [Caerostris extrusa]|uniref:Uncharacterized protein n=1 Tax=Caerostris extrusa TaxID=172846 RepID=A0AAV4QKS6_CAEEX|nr:hypothetical protein CEXT_536001 [Caerostris extrusa]
MHNSTVKLAEGSGPCLGRDDRLKKRRSHDVCASNLKAFYKLTLSFVCPGWLTAREMKVKLAEGSEPLLRQEDDCLKKRRSQDVCASNPKSLL